MENIKAVIFDMDGLLLDTESIAIRSFIEACHVYNFEPDLKPYYQCIGVPFVRGKEILSCGYGDKVPIEEVIRLWGKRFNEETLKRPIPLKRGALELLTELKNRGKKMAVVTSTISKHAVEKLGQTRLLHFFNFVLGGDEISNGKPHPEVYLTACKKLKLSPSRCLALEDSDCGVISAYKAGLMVIQVPDILEPSPEVKTLGHTIVKSLDEVTYLI